MQCAIQRKKESVTERYNLKTQSSFFSLSLSKKKNHTACCRCVFVAIVAHHITVRSPLCCTQLHLLLLSSYRTLFLSFARVQFRVIHACRRVYVCLCGHCPVIFVWKFMVRRTSICSIQRLYDGIFFVHWTPPQFLFAFSVRPLRLLAVHVFSIMHIPSNCCVASVLLLDAFISHRDCDEDSNCGNARKK